MSEDGSRSSSAFLVYACTSCGKRIFTDRSHLGRKGACPMCGAPHEIGARDPSLAAERGVDRRRSRRARAKNAKVAVQGKVRTDVLGASDLHELVDLSATGVGFLVPGQPDSRQLSGERPPALKVGDQLQVTLHVPELEHPRTLKAEVRRVVKARRMWLVGAQFAFVAPDERQELEALLARMDP